MVVDDPRYIDFKYGAQIWRKVNIGNLIDDKV